MRYDVRPISDRSWLNTTPKLPTQFKASWSDTIQLLGAEVDYLKGRDVILEMDIREQDLKLNGELRANAAPASRAVAVSFESKHGPLFYRCDRFYTPYYHQGAEWHHNVRAIAMTLKALRSVDRYGATETGQQYHGYKQLGAGTAMSGAGTSSHMTSSEAHKAVLALAQVPGVWPTSDTGIARVVQLAKRHAHPDRTGGDGQPWQLLTEALTALRLS